MLLLGAVVVVIPSFFIQRDFTYGREVILHDVHDSVVIHYSSQALKMAIELLLLMILTGLIDVTDQD